MILPGLASLPFGIGFGVAAAQKGLSAFETTLMSFTVMAGTSQMVALDIWAQPLPLIALADAPQGGFFSRLWDSILLWFHKDTGNTEQAPGGK